MEWWEVIGLSIVIVVGATVRNFIYKGKYKWRNDSWKGSKK